MEQSGNDCREGLDSCKGVDEPVGCRLDEEPGAQVSEATPTTDKERRNRKSDKEVKQYNQRLGPVSLMRGRVHTTAGGQEGNLQRLHTERAQLNQELIPGIRAYYHTLNVFCFHKVMF